MPRPTFFRSAILALAGLILWGLHFGFIYVWAALVCARGGGGEVFGWPMLEVGVSAATVVAILAISAAMLAAKRHVWITRDDDVPADRFLRAMTMALGLLGLVAVIWNTFPAFLAGACA